MNKYKNLANYIEKNLDNLSSFDKNSTYSVLCDAERYSIMAGGKHLRGMLVMQTAALGNISYSDSVNFACAVEMVHTYSLIHDDLPEMDNDDLRRGKPTCHKKYGADIALLAGDALLTKAFNVISCDRTFSSDKKIECIKILSEACGEHGMLAGQTIDKKSENSKIDYTTLLELHSRKTGDMFSASVKIGSVLGNLDRKISDCLEKYITLLGLAFQIKDDILDVISTEEVLGKPINSDAGFSKSTFIFMLGLEESERLLKEKITEAKEYAKCLNSEFFTDLAEFFENRNM